MKKLMIRLVLLTLALALFSLSASAETVAGGWENVPCEAGVLPEDAQAAFDKVLEESLGDAVWTPVTLLSRQVAAGTNYCILCQITPLVPDHDTPIWALVYISVDPQGSAEVLNVYDLYIDRHVYPAD